MNKFIESLEWRYATKKFNPEKQVSDQDIEYLKEAVRLSVSSFGLQLYKVLIIKDKDIKARLVEPTYNQKQVEQASHVFIFCSILNPGDSHVDKFIENISNIREVSVDSIKGFGDLMKKFIKDKTPAQVEVWADKQNYIAMTNLLNACAYLGIDSCPMEGFSPQKYDEVLGLTEKNLKACLVVPVGYRADDDKYSKSAKVRKCSEEIFEII